MMENPPSSECPISPLEEAMVGIFTGHPMVFFKVSDFSCGPHYAWNQNWRKMTKRKDSTQNVVTAVFSQEHKHYRHWFNSHQLNWVFFWRGDKTQPGRDPYRSQHSAAPVYKVFPLSQALVSILQRALEKVEISTPALHPLPIYTGGKVEQCGSYYLISIPYSQRYFNDLRRALSWCWRWLSSDT